MEENNNDLQKAEKIRLSPGQALLILIEKYKNKLITLNENNEKIKKIESYLEKLYLLYLSGTKAKEDSTEFRKAMTDKSLMKYTISYDYETIDSDEPVNHFV